MTLESATDSALNGLNFKNFPALWRVRAQLAVKSCDPKLDVIFQSQITAMVGVLNLYLDPQLSYTWCEASLIVAKLMGKGIQYGSR